ncbi:MAG TPA: hypothetical protein PKZ84_13410 [Anaerolineae bacterium]|nr:hypothetical protein [Anaerolineae bacterium]HQI86490.1 hypothetical protein [Anaerolineae bacterium]
MSKQKSFVTATLDPRWTAQIYQTVTGEDFLGLRAVQESITSYLLPGITTITPRARYYPFYSWLLVEYGKKHPEGWSLGRFIHRREQIFALANLAWQETAADAVIIGLTGSDDLGEHWRQHREVADIPLSVDNYVKARHGGYDAYAGVMQGLAITRYAENDDGLDVLPKGQALALAFTKSIQDTRYYRNRVKYDTARAIPRDVLLEYGERCHLSYLARSFDGQPTLETLFAFDAPYVLPHFELNVPTLGNMRGTLGMILDMFDQTEVPLTDLRFRECITYGLCHDFAGYQPTPLLRPFVAHWRMFQLREYYVYALYALWSYFLSWLREQGPQTLDDFCAHLNHDLDLAAIATELGISLKGRSLDTWSLDSWLTALLDVAHIPDGNFSRRCADFALQSQAPLQEHGLYLHIEAARRSDLAAYVGITWILLSVLYLRLEGIKPPSEEEWSPWYWARFGGVRRRSLAHFARDMTEQMKNNASLLDALRWLIRDYVIAQHTIAALEKWRQRNAKTFHFNYENGVFEWIADDKTGFSATRFRQASDMLFDLGLYEILSESGGVPRLTALGQQTLQRVLESFNDSD